MKSIFIVRHAGVDIEEFDNLTDAIRLWDQRSINEPDSGITVQTFSGDLMVRDGWIIHILDNQVYLNTGLMDSRG